jgi:hypothetical protein
VPHNRQASPSDPDNFPFVVLGNKIDVENGNTRVVRPLSPLLLCPHASQCGVAVAAARPTPSLIFAVIAYTHAGV